jgi:hypothetical protein
VASEAVGAADRKASRLFMHVGFITCILLMRFGLLSGTSTLSISLPVTGILVLWALGTGRGRFDLPSVLNFMAFLTAIAISTAAALSFPDNRVGISLLSPIALILNYLLLIVHPSERFDKSQGLEIFLFYMRICVFGGILQYLLQFIGIRFFSFTIATPFLKPILIETRFAFDPIVHYGSSLRRSNGLLMVEPSVFSQMIVFATCIEFFLLKRFKMLPVYAIAYLVSGSGTGALCLILTLPFYVIFFTRQSSRLLVFAGIGLLLASILALVLPDQLALLTRRAGEFTTPGTSGYTRYVSQFEVINVVVDEARVLIGYGPGATDRADFYVLGSGGAIQKLLIDYGVFGMLAFFSLMLTAIWRRDMGMIPLLLFITFLFGGGKLLMTPFIVFVILICIWSDPPQLHEADLEQ